MNHRRREMIRAFGLPLICIAMFYLAGGHWAILQTVAWARMIEDYSRKDPINVAILKTFSGKYPCTLCKKVEEGRQKEEAPPTTKVEKKAENFLRPEGQIAQMLVPRDFSYPPWARQTLVVRSDAPLLPPPRNFST